MEKNILSIDLLRAYIAANPSLMQESEFGIFDLTPAQQKILAFEELLEYLPFSDYCRIAIDELKPILALHKSLDHKTIRNWIIRHQVFFNDKLYMFGIYYLDNDFNDHESIFLSGLKEYVDIQPFLSVIQFWECMWVFDAGDYHLAPENRIPPNPLHYYYSAPDPNDPPDIDKILGYLALA